jgi:AraC-like DNA-binding protein
MDGCVAITRATGMGPLPDLLEEAAGDRAVARVFGAERMPLALVHEREHWTPLASLAGLFHGGARAAGDPLFGLRVGQAMQPGEYGRFARYALQAGTLGAAAARLERTFHLHQRGGTVGLEPRAGDRVAWVYRHANARSEAYAQHSDHVLPGLIRAVQVYLGSSWQPDWVEVGHRDAAHAQAREDALGVPWLLGREGAAVVLPREALGARRPAAGRGGPSEREITGAELLAGAEGAVRTAGAEDTPAGRIGAVLALRLLDGHTDIDGAARFLGIGRRTLQRQLAAEGTSYRALLRQVRMARARALIEETDTPLLRVALDVGYTDPAHFTRAFDQQFGHPPSRLRRRA